MMKANKLFNLQGNIALITGGNGGIGGSIAKGFAEAGASVAIFGRSKEKNDRTLAELKKTGVHAMATEIDITNSSALEAAVKKVESELGSISILVNNAGIVSRSGGVLNETKADWENVIDTQLTAVFLLSKLVAKSMAENNCGKIINIGSMYSFFGSGRVPSYSTAKGGVIQLTKSMAIELAPYNIQVNAIAPGWIETDMTAAIKSTPLNDEILLRTPAGRWGKPEEIVGTAIYLASNAANFVSGETVCVDGGYAIR